MHITASTNDRLFTEFVQQIVSSQFTGQIYWRLTFVPKVKVVLMHAHTEMNMQSVQGKQGVDVVCNSPYVYTITVRLAVSLVGVF